MSQNIKQANITRPTRTQGVMSAIGLNKGAYLWKIPFDYEPTLLEKSTKIQVSKIVVGPVSLLVAYY